jgi:MFS family permease
MAPSAEAEGGGFRVWIRHYPLATAYAVNFAAQGVMAMMMAMTSLALSHHGHALPLISVSVSIHVVGMFGLSIPLGRLSDRIGRRPLLLAGCAILAAGSLLVPTSSQYLVITTGTFLVGIGWSCCTVASSALITEVVSPGERGRAIGVSDSISQLASMTMPLAAGPLVVLLGLPVIAAVALVVLIVPTMLGLRLREPRAGVYGHGTAL